MSKRIPTFKQREIIYSDHGEILLKMRFFSNKKKNRFYKHLQLIRLAENKINMYKKDTRLEVLDLDLNSSNFSFFN
jgi:hypothetical protein